MDLKINKLRKLRLTTEKMQSTLSIEVSNLLYEQSMRKYLDTLSHHIESSNSKVAASLFVKRYAFLSVIYLYAMTAWNEKLNVNFENISIETDDNEKLWLPNFHFHSLESESLRMDREKWRTNCIETLFKGHLSPILDLLSQTTKVSKLILWENISVYIYWLYETVLMEEGTPSEVTFRSKEDFRFIVYRASGEIFGDYDVNPLTRFYYEVHENEVRKRSTCCYSHLTNSDKYCATCPHICKRKA
ncbi:IucA/IucC family C-terminal-domain containing protein [Psychrobacillus vulpis]|uniref:Aerobactin siderophore biosynthesis IucA/IucC-like C-terminal domain-containing protein n=1 Tax=Psychrobacillus vulpis TaxID=2325572 RepID=A0A544TW43_9BACI|nr:IucA/IucC family C-terminal-domain containing protein [Psychrobacillus vulpis]TQR21667.1 hypothetical protein FG384_01545 [Psychrobacillus vulpis]